MKKYGKSLVTHLPEESTALLVRLCIGKSSPLSSAEGAFGDQEEDEQQRSKPEEFIHIFVNQRSFLQQFLERIVERFPKSSSVTVWNTLLELYLAITEQQQQQKDQQSTVHSSSVVESDHRAMNLLRNPDAAYDPDHALVLSQLHQNPACTLYLYERLKRYPEILQFHMDHQDYRRVLSCSRKYGEKDPSLWIQVLSYFVDREDCHSELKETLAYVEERNLVAPLRVIQILSKTPLVPLEIVKSFIVKKIKSQAEEVETDKRLIQSYREETEKMRGEMDELKATYVLFNCVDDGHGWWRWWWWSLFGSLVF